ncbi:hypothetical protein J3A78_002361 [Streptomyces sp. PvR006]|uniref:hypothetical protein n=1 Tax=Streptomyces sp. PvR006 TaxID=2817860 RepID=UPI001AE40696|nr:hypothetical protein [Streptomyces sp. PvR006]MBP2581883.1 hypothetical protein [Streptomyces sp. PvR006]
MTFQPEIWHDDWETEADKKAGLDRPRRWRAFVPADHGRPCTRPQIPSRRVVNVIRSL